MMLNLLYFASLREQLNTSSEQLEVGAEINTVLQLKQFLAQRGDHWQQVFEGDLPVLIAVNQQMADDTSPISDGDEIALFPPVTGG